MTAAFPASRAPALRGGPTLRWGVLAPGQIANDFTATVHAHTDQQIVAVASRSSERAQHFAARHHVARAYPAYEQLLADDDVDIVYVAAPHAQHKPLTLLAVDAGKHVLVEKPLALNAAEGREIATVAARAGVMVAEAMWTRYLPQSDVLRQLIDQGRLGQVKLATADVGWQAPREPTSRLFRPDLGGGAALDMGVYGYWFAQFAIGRPHTVAALGTIGPTGVDEQSVAVLTGDGAHAAVTTSMLATNTGLASIVGTAGTVRFVDPFVFPARFTLSTADGVGNWRDTSGLALRQGLAWQAAALPTYIAEGRTDSPVHGLSDAVAVLETIDDVRRQVEVGVAERGFR